MEYEELRWLEALSDEQWLEIRQIARHLFDGGYFSGNQFKITCMALMIWCKEGDVEKHKTEMPNALHH